jgi:hypothetical protein
VKALAVSCGYPEGPRVVVREVVEEVPIDVAIFEDHGCGRVRAAP